MPSGSPGAFAPRAADLRGVAGAGRRPCPLVIGALVCVVALCAVGALFYAAQLQGSVPPSSGVDAQRAALVAMKDRMLRQPLGARGLEGVDPDSPEGRARRELERLYKQYGVGDPPADPEGRVHLRGGGTISADEWRRLRERLGPR
jgi:hypothetical protein